MDRRTSGDRSITPAGMPARPEDVMLPVIEEKLNVEIQKEETGKVRAVKQVHEEDLLVSFPVFDEELIVERIPVNRPVEAAPKTRHEGDTMIIPVMKDEVVVQTRLILVEEIRITRRRQDHIVETPVTLRKEEVTIERSSDKTYQSEKGN